MKGTRKNSKGISGGRIFSVALMFFCLTFLTAINFVIYADQEQSASYSGRQSDESASDFPPSGPTEEKSCSSGVTIVEEFLHDPHPVIHFGVGSIAALHGADADAGILVYHGELLSPPPEL